MIKIVNITKKYKKEIVLNKTNYTFPNKGLILIRGVSGGGKTTLLNIIGGLLCEYEGSLYFKGEKKTKKEDADYYQNKVSYIFQNSNLIEGLSLKENLSIIYKQNKNLNYNEKKFYNVVNNLGLVSLLSKKVKYLSQGEKQKATIARGILSSNNVLLLDEPTGSLNKANTEIIWKILKNLSKNKLVIVVTHNEDLIKNKKNVLILENGILKGGLNDSKYDYKVDKKEFKKMDFINILKVSLLYFKIRFKKMFFLALCVSLSIVASFLLDDIVIDFENNMTQELKSFNEYYLVNKKTMADAFTVEEYKSIIPNFKSNLKDNFIEIINTDMYDYKIDLNSKEIGNGFILSKIKYIDYVLAEQEIVFGGNKEDICKLYNLQICTKEIIKHFLLNNELIIKTDLYTKVLVIKDYIETDEYTLFSNDIYLNERLLGFNPRNKYNYYFVVYKEKKEDFFVLLKNFCDLEVTMVEIDRDSYTYKIEKTDKPYFFEDELLNVDFDYVYCLEEGYNCLSNYGRGMIENIDNVNYKGLIIENPIISLKPFNDRLLDINEIVISSGLAKKINLLLTGETITLNFSNKSVNLKVKEIIEEEEYILFQNSFWSYDFFASILNFDAEDLKSSFLYVKDISKLDYNKYEFMNFYDDILEEMENSMGSLTKYIDYLMFFLNVSSFLMIICLQFMEMNEFFKFIGKIKILGISKYDVNKIIICESFILFFLSVLTSLIYVCLSKIILSYYNIFVDVIIYKLAIIILLVVFFSFVIPFLFLNKKKILDLIKI